MSDLLLLSPARMSKIEPYFPQSLSVSRVDDRRVISGIVYALKSGLQWRYAPAGYRPSKTPCNRFRRWTEMGAFDKIFDNLAAESDPPDTLMIDAAHPLPGRGLLANHERVKAHRTARSLLNGRFFPATLGERTAA